MMKKEKEKEKEITVLGDRVEESVPQSLAIVVEENVLQNVAQRKDALQASVRAHNHQSVHTRSAYRVEDGVEAVVD